MNFYASYNFLFLADEKKKIGCFASDFEQFGRFSKTDKSPLISWAFKATLHARYKNL